LWIALAYADGNRNRNADFNASAQVYTNAKAASYTGSSLIRPGFRRSFLRGLAITRESP